MDFILNVEDLYSNRLKKSDLLRFKYDEHKGFMIDAIELDSVLDSFSTSLSLEKSIKTDFGYLITWTLSTGWIIVPTNMEDKPDLIRYEPLDRFLKRECALKVQLTQQQTITMKEQILNEYIEMLERDIQVLRDYVENEDTVCVDQIVLIIKEHKTRQTQSINELVLLLEKELKAWNEVRENYKRNGSWNLTEMTSNYLHTMNFQVKERKLQYIV